MATRIVREDPHTPRFKAERQPKRRRQKKFGPVRDENYKDWIRKHACCVCGRNAPSEASHHGHHAPGGMGQKPADKRTIPLCSSDHRAWHQHGHFARNGLHTPELARAFIDKTMISLLIEWSDTMGAT